MSSTTHPCSLPRRLRTRLTVLASALALAGYGMLAVAGPAHADANIQITDSADPVPVNTPYTYTATVPNPNGYFDNPVVTVDLTGAAATITGFTTSDPGFSECTQSATHLECLFGIPANSPATVTLTVLPTAAGTVTASAVLSAPGPVGSDSATTTITPAGPVYTFTGFFPPVDNPPTVNTMKAGRAVPVKFSLNGNQGLNIFATGYPVSQNVTCDTGAPLDPVEETTGAGNSSLSYDAATDTYSYVWKTDSAWKNTCRTFDLKLADNSDHTANFKFS
uniref:PxKF domain-containing protein n=1 Tax=Streptomyces sp. NBC_00003 TaxID=2903608 RepID=A0AAU2V7F3_9ACTN